MQELHMFIIFCIFFGISFASIICLCKRLRNIPTVGDALEIPPQISSSNYYYHYSPFIIPVQSTSNNELRQETLSPSSAPTHYGSTLLTTTTENTNEQLCMIPNCPQQISPEQNCTRQNCPQQISSQQIYQQQMCQHQILRYSTMSKNNKQRQETPPPSYEEALKLPQCHGYCHYNYSKY